MGTRLEIPACALLDSFCKLALFFGLQVKLAENKFKICLEVIEDRYALIVGFTMQPDARVLIKLT